MKVSIEILKILQQIFRMVLRRKNDEVIGQNLSQYSIGDTVRVLLNKSQFDNGWLPKYLHKVVCGVWN